MRLLKYFDFIPPINCIDSFLRPSPMNRFFGKILFKIRIREMSSVLNESSKLEFLKHANQKFFQYFSKISSSTFRCLQHALYVILGLTNSTFPNKRTPLFQTKELCFSKHKNPTFPSTKTLLLQQKKRSGNVL